MGSLKSKEEKRLQKKLIPVNIVVCIIALVAAISLFLTPILKIDVGKMLSDKEVIEFADKRIDDLLDDSLNGSDQDGLDYKPLVTNLVNGVLGKAEGTISISAYSAFQVLRAGDNKAQKVLDELLFGNNALATKLINSVVDGVANMFETDEGKELLEEALVSVLTSQIINGVEDKEVGEAIAKNIKDIVGIFNDLGDPSKVPDGKVDEVAGRLVDKLDSLLGEDKKTSEESRQEFIKQVQEIYDNTQKELGEGEKVSIESIICVAVSKNVDLSEININDLLGGVLGNENSESSVHIKTVDAEPGESEGENTDGEPEDEEGEGEPEGGEGEGEGTEGSKNKIVTNYNDMLQEMGFDKDAKNNLKEKMRTTLKDGLNKIISENGISTYLGYYGYLFYGMLVFIVPWLILFLFSFFHLLAKNKRFMMWYVKLICWIPSLIWLVLKLFPIVATKVSFLNKFWNGDNGALIQALFKGVSSLTWINGLCYVLLWLVSIFWAFPIKRKIRRERRHPDGSDEEYDEYEEEEYDESEYDSYYDNYYNNY